MIGGTNLTIGISLILRDQFSGRLNNANQALTRTQKQALAAERAALQSQRNISAAGAISGGVALGVMREWVKVGANFDKQMVYTYSIADKVGNRSLKNLKGQAVKVGQETMFSTTQVAEAMTSMAQAGQNTDQIFKNINSTAVLAAATMSDIQLSASAMNDIMIGFDIPASEKNSMMVADIITQSINKSNIQLKDFSESMKYIIPTARTLNMEMADVATIIAAVGNAGIKGSMAGTNTENMLRYLSVAAGGSKPKQVAALAQLGMKPNDLRDARGNMLPIAQIIERIGASLTKMNNIDRVNVMTDLFGVRGQRPAMLLAQQLSRYSDMRSSIIQDSVGTAQKTANDVMGTTWGNMERLESTWESFKIAFTEAIEPVLVPLLKVVTKILQGIVNVFQLPWGKTLAIVTAGLLLWKTIAFGISTITASIRLYQLGMIQSGTNLGNTMVNQYNRMTTAALRYRSAQQSAMAPSFVGRSSAYPFVGAGPGGSQQMRKNSAGQWIWAQSGPGGKKGQFVSREALGNMRSAKWGALNSKIGNASPYMMLGGLALSMGADAVGNESETGKWMNVGSNTLGMAGTGAMIGSIIPGVGTAAGAIVGAAVGLGWGIYDKLQKEKSEIDAAKAELDAAEKTQKAIDVQWIKDAKSLTGIGPGGKFVRFQGSNNWAEADQQYWERQAQYNQKMWNGGQVMKNSNHIVVNINADKAFDKVVEDSNYTANLNWGF